MVVAEAVKVSVVVPEPPFTVAGRKLVVSPVGAPVTEKVTPEVNPRVGVTVIVLLDAPPCMTLSDEGLADRAADCTEKGIEIEWVTGPVVAETTNA